MADKLLSGKSRWGAIIFKWQESLWLHVQQSLAKSLYSDEMRAQSLVRILFVSRSAADCANGADVLGLVGPYIRPRRLPPWNRFED